MDDDSAFIPCDVCEEVVRFSEYADHIERCSRMYSAAAPLLQPFFPMLQDGLANIQARANRIAASVSQHQQQRASNPNRVNDGAGFGEDTAHLPQFHVQLQLDENDVEDGDDGDDIDGNDDVEDVEDNQLNEDNVDGVGGDVGDGEQPRNVLPRPRDNVHARNLVTFSFALTRVPFGALEPWDTRLGLEYGMPGFETFPALQALRGVHEFDQWVSDVLGPVEVGVDDLASVTTLVSRAEVQPDDVCPICHEVFCQRQPEVEFRKIAKCSHVYCNECITHWLEMSKKCPMCMTRLDDPVPE